MNVSFSSSMSATAASSGNASAYTSFFRNIQMFGFTGYNYFAENAVKNGTGKKQQKNIRGVFSPYVGYGCYQMKMC